MKYTDEILIELLDKRVAFEKLNESEMIDLIREIMDRKLFIKYGATSMYDFMTGAHYDYAPAVAQRKIEAARVMQKFPFVKEWIAESEIGISQLAMMSTAIRKREVDPELQREILDQIRNQTVAATQRILNEKLQIEVQHMQKIREQSDGSFLLQVRLTREQYNNLQQAKDVVSHSVPDGDLAAVIDYCARFTRDKKTTAVRLFKLPGKGIPFAVRCAVLHRDISCRHRHEDGSFCGSTYQRQIDHIISRYLGGGNNIENLQVLCGLHNRLKYRKETG